MGRRFPTDAGIYEALQQTCPALIPRQNTEVKFIETSTDPSGKPEVCNIYGLESLEDGQLRQCQNEALEALKQFQFLPNSLIQIRVIETAAQFEVLTNEHIEGEVSGIEILTGKVAQIDINSRYSDYLRLRSRPQPSIPKPDNSLPIGEKRLPISTVNRLPEFSGLEGEQRVRNLASKYTHWRTIKPDGNGYYRAVAVSYLEHLCRRSTDARELYIFISALPVRLRETLPEFVNQISGLYQEKNSSPRTNRAIARLQVLLRSPAFDLTVIRAFRLIASCRISEIPDIRIYLQGKELSEAQRDIETLGKPTEGVEFSILPHVLQVVTALVQSNLTVTDTKYAPRLALGRNYMLPVLHLLFHNEHFEVLYSAAVQNVDQYDDTVDSFAEGAIGVIDDTGLRVKV